MFFSDQIRCKFRFEKKAIVTLLVLLSATAPVLAKGAEGPPPVSSMENPMVIILLIIISVLALVLALLAWVVNGAAGVFLKKAETNEADHSIKQTITGVGIIILLLVSPAGFAQDVVASNSGPSTVGGLDLLTFCLMAGIIGLELVGILYLVYNLKLLIKAERAKIASVETAGELIPKKPAQSLWTKLNSFKPVEQEADIDMGHEYDGIRELDNKLPPWWLYGFYLTILFSVIYLWRFEVSHSAPSTLEEYQIAMNEAAIAQEAYLKKAANKVDENSVVMLDASGISAGQSTFVTNCAACHGKLGEGGVGPNLTDDYWLHGGKINDIFKTIKYGYPEKGMRAWKDEFGPVKIAEMASFIKSIHGTNPPNGKEKQGDLYTDSTSPKDSTTITPKDSTSSVHKDSTLASTSGK